MEDEVIMRFWQPAPETAGDFACAYLGSGRYRAHVHEEWQFAVPELPSRAGIGAYRQYTARASDVIVIAPYEVHTEGGSGMPASGWCALYVAPVVVRRIGSGVAMRDARWLFPAVVSDPAAALELRRLLADSAAGVIDGREFEQRAVRWLEQFFRRHAGTGPAAPSRAPAVERALHFLQDRATGPVTLNDIGAVAGVTVSRLMERYGLTPRAFQGQYRIRPNRAAAVASDAA